MKISDFLFEAQNYEQMFNDLIKLDPQNEQLHQQIKDNVQWARQNLKKNDRIVWFLRWVKVLMYRNARSPNLAGMANQGLDAHNQRYRTNYSWNDVRPSQIEQLKTDLVHYLGMDIPAIQQHVFANESPTQLFAQFEQAEDAWRASMAEDKSLLEPQEGDEIVLQFPDGFAWWKLSRGACSAEADAMGHCGNVPSEKRGDQILSLRRKVVKNGMERWYPVATFILDRDNILGEMKGRANVKPEPKYHPYIIELLKHDMIEGIKGGGYMPEANFSMHDLDDQTREDLLAQKPELGSFSDFYEKEGMTQRVLSMLTSKMNEKGLPDFYSYEPDSKEFILTKYGSLDDFCRSNGDGVVKDLLDLKERAESAQPDVMLNAKIIYEFLDQLPDHVFADIATQMGFDPTDPNSEKDIARQLDVAQGPFYYEIEQAFLTAANASDLLAEVDERIRAYVDVGWSFECTHVLYRFADENDIYTSDMYIIINEREMVNIVDASKDDEYGDDEYAYDADRVASNGEWDRIDWDNLNERRRDEGLTKESKKGRWADPVDDMFPDPENIDFDPDDLLDKAVDIFSNRTGSPTIHDPRQLTLPGLPPKASQFPTESIDHDLAVLRRRAGIGI